MSTIVIFDNKSFVFVTLKRPRAAVIQKWLTENAAVNCAWKSHKISFNFLYHKLSSVNFASLSNWAACSFSVLKESLHSLMNAIRAPFPGVTILIIDSRARQISWLLHNYLELNSLGVSVCALIQFDWDIVKTFCCRCLRQLPNDADTARWREYRK